MLERVSMHALADIRPAAHARAAHFAGADGHLVFLIDANPLRSADPAGVREQPVAQNLFTIAPALRLIGGRHCESRRIVFPLPTTEGYEAIELPCHGLLWSYTLQRYAPKSPPYLGSEPFEPFALGYVELADALIVESRLTEVDFRALRIGMPMELTTMVLRCEAHHTRVITYAFRPQQRSR